jgi:hypothetical protein
VFKRLCKKAVSRKMAPMVLSLLKNNEKYRKSSQLYVL